MKSFESGALAHVDSDKAYEKADKILNSSRFKEEDFIEPHGPYSKGSVERDLAQVKKDEQYHFQNKTEASAENKKLANILEAIILEHGELSEWFGPNAFTYKTSKFDDYENGVDALIEFRSPDTKAASYVGLGVDITFSSDTTQKFDRLRNQIDSEKLTIVKYFHSEYTNFQGRLNKLPEVIIGADRNTIKELTEHWLNRENSKLAKHRVQIMILKQMADQLRTFAMYAEKIGKYETQQIYLDRLDVVRRILLSKEELVKEVAFDLNNDTVHYNIVNFLSNWRKEMEEESAEPEQRLTA